MNRTKQPLVHSLNSFSLMPFHLYKAENGCVLYHFPYVTLPVAKVDFVFPAGRFYQPRTLIASYTSKMLTEGTSSRTDEDIANTLDYLGASLIPSAGPDLTQMTAFALNRNIPDLLFLLQDIFLNATFPENQLKIIAENDKQEFFVNKERVAFLAKRELHKVLFTENHPYCSPANAEDYDTVQSKMLSNFYNDHYSFSQCKVFWCGELSKEHLNLFFELFGQKNLARKRNNRTIQSNLPIHQPGRSEIHKESAKQSALAIGRLIPNIDHADYIGLQFLNTILGGYFGSRLMKNIREDKGYTYGIGSYLTSYLHAASLTISTQVKAEHTEDAINEINKEIKRLQTEPVSTEELELVRNYMSGQLLQSIDGPFAQSAFFSRMLEHGIDAQTHLNKIFQTIQTISKETLIQLAEKYLPTNKLHFVVAGKIKEKKS